MATARDAEPNTPYSLSPYKNIFCLSLSLLLLIFTLFFHVRIVNALRSTKQTSMSSPAHVSKCAIIKHK